MTDKTDVKRRLLEIFEAHRETPGAPFENEDFVRYLTVKPDAIDKGGFSHTRRLIKFREAVQLEFRICFTGEDYERNWSFEALCKRIQERMNVSNLNVVQRRVKQTGKYIIDEPLKLGLLFGGPALFIFFAVGNPYIKYGSVLAVTALIIWVAFNNIQEWLFYKRLQKLIQEST